MGAITDYLANKILDKSLRNIDFTVTTRYLALFTDVPTTAGTGTEVSAAGTAYARQAISFNPAASRATDNSADVIFPQASATWGLVKGWAVMDAASGGNMLLVGALTYNKQIDPGDQFKMAAGDLDVSLT